MDDVILSNIWTIYGVFDVLFCHFKRPL